MKFSLIAPLLLLVSSCGSMGQGSSISLGELSAWRSLGNATWSQDADLIVGGSSGDGFLVSNLRYRNYVLMLEFRVDAITNSGVFVNCSDPNKVTPLSCYEINIWDDHPQQQYRTGSIVAVVEPY